MRHGKRPEMEDPAVLQHVKRQFVFAEHHVRAGAAVEGKIAVSARLRMHDGERRVDHGVIQEVREVDACLSRDRAELVAEAVLADLADEGGLPADLLQHREHVAGCAAGIRLKEGIPLFAESVLGKIDKQFAEGDDVKTFHLILRDHTISSYFSTSMTAVPSQEKEMESAVMGV